MLNLATLHRDFAAIMADLPDTLTFGSGTIACTAVTPHHETLQALRTEFAGDYRLSVAIPLSGLPAVPGVDSLVTYAGALRRVVSFDDTPDKLQRTLHLGDKYTHG